MHIVWESIYLIIWFVYLFKYFHHFSFRLLLSSRWLRYWQQDKAAIFLLWMVSSPLWKMVRPQILIPGPDISIAICPLSSLLPSPHLPTQPWSLPATQHVALEWVQHLVLPKAVLSPSLYLIFQWSQTLFSSSTLYLTLGRRFSWKMYRKGKAFPP